MTLAPASALPLLDSPYALNAAQRAAYDRDGHICLRGVASPDELAPYEAAISALVARLKAGEKPVAERDTYHKAFLQCGHLCWMDETVKCFVLARRFGRIAAELMGVSGVRLYHDQALYKEPGGGHTPWHQDQVYWPFEEGAPTITMWMPLVNAPMESGTMVFASGTHKAGYLSDDMFISDKSSEFFYDLVTERGWDLRINDMKAGDATFHHGLTLHKAPGNSTGILRKVMTIIYYADGTRIAAKPRNEAQKMDMQACFPGQQPGDLAGTDINPLIWSAE